ncbi:MAG: HAD family hydrolase [Hespellia sp.]|nr:HAD family hydrolase [Hespellia sp.]
MIKVIAADLDGTLLGTNHVLNRTTYEAILRAQRAGIRFVVATGRDYIGAIRTFNGFDLGCDWIVASGAEIRNSKGEVLQSIPMRPENFPIILDRLKGLDVHTRFCVTGKDYVIGDEEEVMKNLMEEAKLWLNLKEGENIKENKEFKVAQQRVRCIGSLEELLAENLAIYKVFVSSANLEQIALVNERLADLTDIASASSFVTNVELTDVKAQKGPIIKQYIEERGYRMDEVMVLGDSLNDYSMISMDFGATIAMENGMEEIKKAAKYVTKSNAENGVAYTIDRLLAVQGRQVKNGNY